MARRVFFSFNYQRDVWRVNQIRSMPNIIGCSAAGFQDASLWEDAKNTSDEAVKQLIDGGLKNTSVTVVCIGAQTAGRKYINYEIQKSIDRGNGIVGIQIHELQNQDGIADSGGGRLQSSPTADTKSTNTLTKKSSQTESRRPPRPRESRRCGEGGCRATQAQLLTMPKPRRSCTPCMTIAARSVRHASAVTFKLGQVGRVPAGTARE